MATATVPAPHQHQKLAVTASSKASPLRWMTAGNPTNFNMLLFRTLNRAMGMPNSNNDELAPLLRDKLMPLRMWWLKNAPGAMKQFRMALEHKKLGAPGVVNFVDARTKWFDQMMHEAITQHGIKQVVVVAAGFDTRSYRFGGQHLDVKFFEIDLPHASSKKQQLVKELLQPESSYPRPTYIPADLSKVSLEQALASTAFDTSAPTLFTVEGLIYYLPPTAVLQLFGAILTVAAPGSRTAFDFLHQKVLEGSVPLPPAYKVTAQSVANKGEPFISGIEDSEAAVAGFMRAAASTAAPGKAFRLTEFIDPKAMVAKQLPHLQWDEKVPPILSFYSFAAFEIAVA